MTKSDAHDVSQEDLPVVAAFLVALVATLGALFIGEVLGQMPCTLCWYQRIAMFPLVPIFALSFWRGDGMAAIYGLPLALAGLLLAIWHSGIYSGLIPKAIAPCTLNAPSCSDEAQSILNLPIPYLSLIAFAAIAICLLTRIGKRA